MFFIPEVAEFSVLGCPLAEMNNNTNQEKRSGGRERNTYFCMGLSKTWREKI